MKNYANYETMTLERKDQVATVTFVTPPHGSKANFHWDVGALFSDLRDDNSVRIIVLQGSGGQFRTPGLKQEYDHKSTGFVDRTDSGWLWNTFTGILRCHQSMAEIEKVVIAKVNGDAIGMGATIAFGCDFIIAREDAIFLDHHMGGTFTTSYNGEKKVGGHDSSNVAGDGGCSLMPLHMSPCMAKEYLMLSRSYTGAELARMGIINYAVPAADLDAKVDDIVQRLLQKGAYALARTKRLLNRRVVAELNLTLDASVAYEMVTHLQTPDLQTPDFQTLDRKKLG